MDALAHGFRKGCDERIEGIQESTRSEISKLLAENQKIKQEIDQLKSERNEFIAKHQSDLQKQFEEKFNSELNARLTMEHENLYKDHNQLHSKMISLNDQTERLADKYKNLTELIALERSVDDINSHKLASALNRIAEITQDDKLCDLIRSFSKLPDIRVKGVKELRDEFRAALDAAELQIICDSIPLGNDSAMKYFIGDVIYAPFKYLRNRNFKVEQALPEVTRTKFQNLHNARTYLETEKLAESCSVVNTQVDPKLRTFFRPWLQNCRAYLEGEDLKSLLRAVIEISKNGIINK